MSTPTDALNVAGPVEMAKLVDPDDGENQAVRMFLMAYGGGAPKTVGQFRSHMSLSGFDSQWPQWVEKANPGDHLTKGGAQSWLRHLFALEARAALASSPAAGTPAPCSSQNAEHAPQAVLSLTGDPQTAGTPVLATVGEQAGWVCTDKDGHSAIGFTKDEAKYWAASSCNEYLPVYYAAPHPQQAAPQPRAGRKEWAQSLPAWPLE